MLDTVKATIKKYNLIRQGDRILLGVSGGPDSLALVLVLNALQKELGVKLHIAHLDHGLRADSVQDAVFVRKFSVKLGVPVTLAKTKIFEPLHRNPNLQQAWSREL